MCWYLTIKSQSWWFNSVIHSSRLSIPVIPCRGKQGRCENILPQTQLVTPIEVHTWKLAKIISRSPKSAILKMDVQTIQRMRAGHRAFNGSDARSCVTLALQTLSTRSHMYGFIPFMYLKETGCAFLVCIMNPAVFPILFEKVSSHSLCSNVIGLWNSDSKDMPVWNNVTIHQVSAHNQHDLWRDQEGKVCSPWLEKLLSGQ